MTTAITSYLALADEQRDSVRSSVRSLAVRAREHYADLLAADAGAAARDVFPNLTRLVFTVAEDILGPSVSLVAAYDAAGRRLWHVDHDDEWPDESEVTDKLAAACEWSDGGHLPFAVAADDAELYEYRPRRRPT